jgi:hypothetical protein
MRGAKAPLSFFEEGRMDDVGLLFGLVTSYVPCLLMLAGIVLAVLYLVWRG